MAASSTSSSSADARTLEQLAKENADLQREIATIRASLGLDKKEEEEEKARVLAVFKKYDADNSGTIDRKEFDAVAYDAGYDPSGLDEKGVSKIFDEIKPAAGSSVTFEEFYKWFKVSASSSTKSKTYQLGHAVRLQAKSWGKSVEGGRGALKAAKARLALPRAVGAAAPRAEIKSAFTSETRDGVRVRLSVGEVKEVKTAIVFATKTDASAAEALRTTVGVPEGKTAFGFVDLALASDADEGQLGELAGILESVLGMVGGSVNEKAGVPLYNSHTVKIVTDAAGQKVLRLAFFAEMNPLELAAAATGQDPAAFSLSGLLDLRVAFETSLALASVRDDAFVLSPDLIRARLTVDGSIASSLDKRAGSLAVSLGLPRQAAAAATAIGFFKGLNIDVETVSLAEFAARFAGQESELATKINGMVGALSSTPVGPVVKSLGLAHNVLAQLNALAGPEMKSTLDSALKNITGPSRVHVQIDNTEFVLQFTGVSVLSTLAYLGAGASPSEE